FYLASAATQPPVTAAERVLTLLGNGEISDAYASTATDLRNQHTEAEFAAEVQRLGLTDYASSSWPSRDVVNHETTIEGRMTTTKGRRVQLTIKLLKEGNDWRV